MIKLTDNNFTRALTVYVPPQTQHSKAIGFTKRITNFLGYTFCKRKFTYLLFLSINIFSLFFSYSLAYTDCRFAYALLRYFSTFCGKGCAIYLFLVTLSGFTLFGRFTSVLFNFFLSFSVGIFLRFLISSNFDNYYFVFSFFLFASILLFLAIIFSVEVFVYSKRAVMSKSALFSFFPCVGFILLSLLCSTALIFLYKYIINLLLAG